MKKSDGDFEDFVFICMCYSKEFEGSSAKLQVFLGVGGMRAESFFLQDTFLESFQTAHIVKFSKPFGV